MASNDKFVVERADHEEKEYHPQPDKPEVFAQPILPSTAPLPPVPNAYWHNPQLQAHILQKERPLWKTKRLWLPLAALILIPAVIGGTLGALKSREDSSPTSAPPAAGTASAIPSNTGSIVTSTPSPSAAPFNSSLASVAWTDKDGGGNRRLYYQDSAGTVKESAWNSSAAQWYSSNEALGDAKLNSPLAASVLGDQRNDLIITLYFLNPEGQLVVLNSFDGGPWSKGKLSDENVRPSPDSALAAIWTAYDGAPCRNCGEHNRLLVYEDNEDKLRVINATGAGFRHTRLAADPIPGSGLAVNLVWRNEGGPGLKVYYQKGADSIMCADWEDGESGSGKWEWTLHEDSPLGQASSQAPMAAFSWGDDTDTGGPLLMNILSSGPRGIDVSRWTPQGWQKPARPDIMKNVQAYSALAANGDGHVYALEAGSVKEFEVSTDGLIWSLVGDVPIKM
ncbi:MAG: hypothetical protein Q9193_003158 [Seirophora villosa]